ncbi:MAG: hypothetical protein AAF202_11555, partial [Pseudomonadota bacterium]
FDHEIFGHFLTYILRPDYAVRYRQIVKQFVEDGGWTNGMRTGRAIRILYFNESLTLVDKQKLLERKQELAIPEDETPEFGDFGYSYLAISRMVRGMSDEELYAAADKIAKMIPDVTTRLGGLVSQFAPDDITKSLPHVNNPGMGDLVYILSDHWRDLTDPGLDESYKHEMREHLTRTIRSFYSMAELTIDDWAEAVNADVPPVNIELFHGVFSFSEEELRYMHSIGQLNGPRENFAAGFSLPHWNRPTPRSLR